LVASDLSLVIHRKTWCNILHLHHIQPELMKIFTLRLFFPINTSNKDDYISMESSINNNKKSTTNQNP
jgi:hypothetical protein